MTIEFHSHSVWELAFLTASTGVILGHNLWLIAKEPKAKDSAPLRFEVHVGHHFAVSEWATKPEAIAEFALITSHGAIPVENIRVEGLSLVADAAPPQGSVARVAALVTRPRPITLDVKQFAAYINEEDASAAVAPDFREGVTTAPQHEVFSKYAKAILSADDADDTTVCKAVGHKIEIVPEIDPARLSGGGRLPVRVLFDGEPVAGLRLSSSCDRLNGGHYAAHVRTDEAGRAAIELTAPGYWCVRANYIRLHPDPQTAKWESFWPSLTFQINE